MLRCHRSMLGCLCAAYLKPRHAAGHKSDVDPAGIGTVIYSVRFEFHLSTNTHVLFLAFRWGAPCQPALQHSLCLWLYGSWSARSFGNCTTYNERGGTITRLCVHKTKVYLTFRLKDLLVEFSYLPVEGMDTRTPKNFLMRDDRKVLSFLALQET